MNSSNLKSVIASAFTQSNSAYIARNANPKLDKNGMNADIAKGLSFMLSITEAQFKALNDLDIRATDLINTVSTSTNVKKALRVPQFTLFILTGDARYLKASSLTALLAFCGLMIGVKNRNGLNFVVTGKGDENTSDSLPSLQKAREIQKLFNTVGVSTAPTQLSVAFSKGGILPALGLTATMSKGESLPAINNTKLAQALITLITTASESKIQLWVAQSTSK